MNDTMEHEQDRPDRDKYIEYILTMVILCMKLYAQSLQCFYFYRDIMSFNYLLL